MANPFKAFLQKLGLAKGEAVAAPQTPGVVEGGKPVTPLTAEGMSWANTSREGQQPNPVAFEAGTVNPIPNPEAAQPVASGPEAQVPQTPSGKMKG